MTTPTSLSRPLQKAQAAPQPPPVSSPPDEGAESFSEPEEEEEGEEEDEEDGREGVVIYDFSREFTIVRHLRRIIFIVFSLYRTFQPVTDMSKVEGSNPNRWITAKIEIFFTSKLVDIWTPLNHRTTENVRNVQIFRPLRFCGRGM